MISIAFAFYLNGDDGSSSSGSDYDGEYHFIVRNHRYNIPPYIQLINGISIKDSKNIETTTSLKEVLHNLMKFVDENTRIIAHDAKFHKIVIANELCHAGMSKELELWKSLHTYCTLQQQSVTNQRRI